MYTDTQWLLCLKWNSRNLCDNSFSVSLQVWFAILKNVIAMPQFVIALPPCHASALPELKCFSNPICDCIFIANENACQSKTVGGTVFGACNISDKLPLS